jgi:hypothetical protein
MRWDSSIHTREADFIAFWLYSKINEEIWQ